MSSPEVKDGVFQSDQNLFEFVGIVVGRFLYFLFLFQNTQSIAVKYELWGMKIVKMKGFSLFSGEISERVEC